MRPLLLLVLALPSFSASLEIVRPILSTSDGGAALPPDFEYRSGDIIFFSCRVRNYEKTAGEKVNLAYSIEALDSKSVPLAEPVKNGITEEVSPQDKDWMPRIATEIALPPLIAAGTYQIAVVVEDLAAKSKVELQVPFRIRGQGVTPSDSLTVENLRFFRAEEESQPLEKPAYRAGDAVWTRFNITGFHYGAHNRIDVSYAVSVLDGSGKVLWSQEEPTGEQSESFYPKLWIPASLSITTQKGTRAGEYGIVIHVKDAVGNQSYETKALFEIE
jgi:hypothetical protein